MWGFGGALYLRARVSGDRTALDGLAAENYNQDVPSHLATAAWFTVIITSLAVAATFLLLIPLLGRQGATLGGLLVALDPFFLSHSRIVHVDGILSSCMLTATLAFAVYVTRPKQRWYLVLSGVLAGLAFLTKTPSLFLMPLMALILGVEWLLHRAGHSPWGRLGRVGGTFVLWLVTAWLTFLALWPATWQNPLFFFWRLYKASRWGVTVSHGSNFFLGQAVEDPGLWFYPVVFPFRLSPLVLLLLPTALVLLVVAWRRKQDIRLPLIALASILFFTVMMSLAAKKGDRYLLPVYPMADVLAAWAAVAVLSVLPQRRQGIGYWAVASTVLAVSLLWLPLAPYYGAYFNPLVGGGPQAERTFAFGQGEGLDLAASYLNAKDNAEELLAVSFYPPQFRYYFDGEATSLRRGDWDKTWQFADYVVFYVSQVQRGLPTPDLVAFFSDQEPEYAARLGGVDFARVYRSPVLLDGQEPSVEARLTDTSLEGKLGLTGYAASTQTAKPGDTLYVTLYWQALEQLGHDYEMQSYLADAHGAVVWEQDGPLYAGHFPTSWWRPGRTMYARYAIPMPESVDTGPYHLLTGARNPNTGQALEPHGPVDTRWPDALFVADLNVAGDQESGH